MYTIWMCCGEFEQFDNRDEAITSAAAYMNGEGHRILGVEGPNFEDLMPRVEEESDKQSQSWSNIFPKSAPRPIGRIEIMGPTGQWWGWEPMYTQAEMNKRIAELRDEYGTQRVRWIESVD